MTSRAAQLDILNCADISVDGRMPWSSNATYLVTLSSDAPCAQAIYKPLRGERPLWDFAPGLHRRELAAYLLSEHMQLDLVPPTVIRSGPMGEGSLQWYVDADHQQHYFTLLESRPEVHDTMRAVAIFDIVANNTDRKSGHVLIDHDGHVWGIDHGLCFADEFKLRTVVWEFAGEPIADDLLDRIRGLADTVPLPIAALLSDTEVEAMQQRVQWLLDAATFPVDRSGRRYPWPLV